MPALTRNRRARPILLLGCLVLLAGCGRPAYTHCPPVNRGPWVAFGDSLTAGTGAAAGADYPARLATRLGIPIINEGVPGDTTADGLARTTDILAHGPAVVLLCLGGNDALRGVALDETLANLGAIIARLQRANVCVVLIGVRSASLIDRHHRPYRDLAREKNILYLPDILDGVLGKPRLMADKIHPNAAGYDQIAARLATDLAAAGLGQ